MVTVRIKEFTYNMLKRYAKGGEFQSDARYKDGHYYIEIDDNVYRKLLEIDSDVNIAILWLVIGKKLKKTKNS